MLLGGTMSNSDKRLQIYVPEDEYQQLKEWSNETGKSMSQLGREAISEYTDYDRLNRIEQLLAHQQEQLERLSDTLGEMPDTHAQTGVYNGGANTIPEKSRKVAQHIYDNYECPLEDADVELAIENIAGVGDQRSINNYKQQLKKRGLLYEHPTSNVWTDNKERWVSWVEGAYHDPDVYEVTDQYKMSTDEYIELAEQ